MKSPVHRSLANLPGHPVRQRLRLSLLLLAGVFVFGTIGYRLLGVGKWSWLDCAYMTTITLTTVGYGDVLGVQATSAGKIYTMVLLVSGMGIVLYSVSAITALIVEGDLGHYFREKKMLKKASEMERHVIVCGVGSTGIHIVEELHRNRRAVVAIEADEAHIGQLIERLGPEVVVLHGDAAHEDILVAAGIERAETLVAALHEDRDNMLLVVTARVLNPDVRIISKCVEIEKEPMFRRAGANGVVSPNRTGGMRVASQILRPNVVDFLDQMLRQEGEALRFAEVRIRPGSPLAGKTLSSTGIGEKLGVRIVAGFDPSTGRYEYNLGGNWMIRPESVLIFIGDAHQAERFRAMAG